MDNEGDEKAKANVECNDGRGMCAEGGAEG